MEKETPFQYISDLLGIERTRRAGESEKMVSLVQFKATG
jgi:hypothetical protein